jgi:hypothetical protein
MSLQLSAKYDNGRRGNIGWPPWDLRFHIRQVVTHRPQIKGVTKQVLNIFYKFNFVQTLKELHGISMYYYPPRVRWKGMLMLSIAGCYERQVAVLYSVFIFA